MIAILTYVFCALSIAFNVATVILMIRTSRNMREVKRLRGLR